MWPRSALHLNCIVSLIRLQLTKRDAVLMAGVDEDKGRMRTQTRHSSAPTVMIFVRYKR